MTLLGRRNHPFRSRCPAAISLAAASVALLAGACGGGSNSVGGPRSDVSEPLPEPHAPAPVLPSSAPALPPFPEVLAAAVADSDPMRSLTLGEARVDLARANLQRAATSEERLARRLSVARELLRAGNTEEAIDALIAARRALANTEAPSPPRRQIDEWLAVAYLRLGEEENCIALHGAGSCLLPIREEARHVEQRGSLAATVELRALLDEAPGPGLRWLLNLAAMTLGEYPEGVPEEHRLPPAMLEGGATALPRFVDRAAEVGLDIVGLSGGVVVEDLDGDGLLDVMVSSWGLHDPLRLFRNEGDGSFTETTAEAGLEGETGGLNLVHADDNNDGHPDVLVLRGAWLGSSGLHPGSLLRNRGDGTFVNVTREAGVLGFFPTQTAAWADVDGDGWLDLFIGHESGGGVHAPCQLFRNNADGTYTDVALPLGVDVTGFVKGVAWGDVDEDGWPDLYLSLLGGPNRLLRNPGAGRRFLDVTATAGVGEPVGGFPTWFWDYDNDGRQDLMAASHAGLTAETLDEVVRVLLGEPTDAQRPRLYRNLGGGRFADVTAEAGVDEVLLAMGSNFGDLDNDGFLDAYFGTGEPSLRTLVPNRMFHNRGDGTFADVSLAAGFGHLQKGHGIAFADLDNDGDQDVYAVMGGAYAGDVYPNALFVNPGNGNAWLKLRLEGTRANRSAIGARVEVRLATEAGERSIFRTVGTGGSFGSDPLRLEIGLGTATAIAEVIVTWPPPARRQQRFTGLEPRAAYLLREGESEARRLELPRFEL